MASISYDKDLVYHKIGQIKGMRNHIAHGYFEVNAEFV